MDRLKIIRLLGISFIMFPLTSVADTSDPLSETQIPLERTLPSDRNNILPSTQTPASTPQDQIERPDSIEPQDQPGLPSLAPENRDSISPSIDIDEPTTPATEDLNNTNDSLHRNTNRMTNEQLRSIERQERPVFDSNKDTQGTMPEPDMNEGVQPINKGFENSQSKVKTKSNLDKANSISKLNVSKSR